MTNKQLYDFCMEQLNTIGRISLNDIPNIDLYMDQVTTFMDKHLSNTKRNDDDKILTKTMINNYAKNDLLPPPNKKKYSKDHIIFLIFIYYYKNFLSIGDIHSVLEPLHQAFDGTLHSKSLSDIYEEVFSFDHKQMERLRKDLEETFEASQSSFLDASEEEREVLQRFALICMLSFDIYLKKQMVETLIDETGKEKK